MRSLLNFAIVGFLATVGCTDKGHDKGKSTDQSPPAKQSTEQKKSTDQQQKDKKAEQQKKQQESKAEEAVKAPDMNTVAKNAEQKVEAATHEAAPSPQQEKKTGTIESTYEDVKGKVVGTVSKSAEYIEGKYGQVTNSVGDFIANVQEGPVVDEGMTAARSEEELAREQKNEVLQKQALESKALRVEDAQAAIQPKDEVTSLLVKLMDEPSSDRIPVLTTALVEEIFNEPGVARAKIMEVQLGLRHLAEHNLYNQDQSRRVAYLQSELDSRIKGDQATEVFRDGLIIAGSSAALGVVAGFHGVDKLRAAASEFSGVGPSISSGAARVKGTLVLAKDGVKSAVRQGREAIARRIMPLRAEQVASRNLKAVGLSDQEVEGLELSAVGTFKGGYHEFNATNLQGFRYAVTDSWNGADLGSERVILISLPRKFPLPTNRILVSRKLPAEDAEALAQKLKYVAPEEGGPDFVTVVDAETGESVATRIPAEDLTAEMGGAPKIVEGTIVDEQGAAEATAPRRRRASRRSVAEAQADGDVPQSYGQQPSTVESAGDASATEIQAALEGPAEAPKASYLREKVGVVTGAIAHAAQGVSSTAKAAVVGVKTGSQNMVRGTTEKFGPALRNFDGKWATTVAVGSAIPLYGLYYRGYGSGHGHGENYQTIYLESLIPHDSLKQVALEIDPSGNQ